ncbi:hypothetical protein FIBSPDRAFT_1047252 [Athelia psychrophila]|uniref:F-box domain-containing protein n=1 Tax=Athelia psychrophila TaxID=1759441 RepID=A0A166FGM7_9AGAM|nr:hypothetical protein FIBSPDRAFT_1047252 [Fibularhizoctonia sp. CBS 109695]
MPALGVSPTPKESTLAHTSDHSEDGLSSDVLHIIFAHYISEAPGIRGALLLAHVSRRWLRAAYALPALWRPFHLNTSQLKSYMPIQDLNTMLSVFPVSFSSIDLCITIPRGISPRSSADLISDLLHYHDRRLRELDIIVSSPGCFDYLVKSCRLGWWTSLKILSIRNISKEYFHLYLPNGTFSESLQTLELFELDGLLLPSLSRLETLTLSGSKNRVPLEEVVVFLSKLPHLRKLVFDGTPIKFKSTDSVDFLSSLLPLFTLPVLTSLRFIGLRTRREHTPNYLARLLALISTTSTLASLEVTTGNAAELEDLVSALWTACPSPHFPILRTATFRIIRPNKTSIRRLLNILSNIRHAIMFLSPSRKEYSLVFKPANSQATLSRSANIPSLEKVELLFTTEDSLQEFIDVAAVKKGGLKTIHASPATIYELRASGIWTMMPMAPQLCNKTRDPLHSHAHIVCEGDEFTELCLVVARGPDMRWNESEGLTLIN